MPCYTPLQAWRGRVPGKSGKTPIVFDKSDSCLAEIQVPCGQCIGCRLERSRQWAIRCVHEASLHRDNCFITLTYDDENLPPDGSLNVKHFQDFMKRLRKHIHPHKVRFYHCGEYGSKLGRPHYHAILFGWEPGDLELWQITKTGERLYISPTLQKLWPFGFSTVGAVTFESAAYVARYILKKQTGEQAELHYTRLNASTGELEPIRPEYTTMSRRPGIAADWYDQFKDDVFPDDFVVHENRKLKPPRYYLDRYEIEEPDLWKKIKARRKKAGQSSDNSPERLEARHIVKLAQAEKLERNLEQ